MSKRENSENNYPFYWLDEVVEQTLNPAKNKIETITPETLQVIRDRLPEEFIRISAYLKEQAFCLYESEHLRVVAGHYDQAIRLLLEQTRQNLSHYPKSGPFHDTGQLLVRLLNEMSDLVQNRYDNYLSEIPKNIRETKSNAQKVQRTMFKVFCKLSVDQMGLILKAADDLKLVVARSLSQVYKTIVPFLSTANRKDISWDSMRSSTYHPEETDKEAAISALEKMISKIREYR